MELTNYLVLQGERISLYNREDILLHDLKKYGSEGCRLFKLQKGLMNHYEETTLCTLEGVK